MVRSWEACPDHPLRSCTRLLFSESQRAVFMDLLKWQYSPWFGRKSHLFFRKKVLEKRRIGSAPCPPAPPPAACALLAPREVLRRVLGCPSPVSWRRLGRVDACPRLDWRLLGLGREPRSLWCREGSSARLAASSPPVDVSRSTRCVDVRLGRVDARPRLQWRLLALGREPRSLWCREGSSTRLASSA